MQQTVITKLRKAGAEPFLVDSEGAHHYKDLKFNQVSFRSGKERVISEERRLAASERFKKITRRRRTYR